MNPKNEPMIIAGKLTTLEDYERFFEVHYGLLNTDKYGTLFTDDGKYNYTIDTSTEEGRKVMAKTAFLMHKAGLEPYFGGVSRELIDKQATNKKER